MQETSSENILQSAILAKQAKKEWHHHYLPPGCLFNTSAKHALVMEIEGKNAEVCYFDTKPLAKLELLENLFFNR